MTNKYDKITMALLIRKTKKCCLKMFRKLNFNNTETEYTNTSSTATTTTTTAINSGTATRQNNNHYQYHENTSPSLKSAIANEKYQLANSKNQNNNQNINSNNQNNNYQRNNHRSGRSKIAPTFSPEHSNSFLYYGRSADTNSTLEDILSEEEMQMNNYNHSSPSLSLGSSSISSVPRHQQQQLQSLPLQLQQQQQQHKSVQHRELSARKYFLNLKKQELYHQYQNQQHQNHEETQFMESNFMMMDTTQTTPDNDNDGDVDDDDDEIIFTENKIYIGLNKMHNALDNENDNYDGRNFKQQYELTNNKCNEKKSFEMTSKFVANQNFLKGSNSVDVHSVDFNKFHEKLSFNQQSPKRLISRSDGESSASSSTSGCGRGGGGGGGGGGSGSSNVSGSGDGIVFEKVKYDKNKRYYKQSPSPSLSSSGDSKYLEQYFQNHHTNRGSGGGGGRIDRNGNTIRKMGKSSNWLENDYEFDIDDLVEHRSNNNNDIENDLAKGVGGGDGDGDDGDGDSSYGGKYYLDSMLNAYDPWYLLNNGKQYVDKTTKSILDNRKTISRNMEIHYENYVSNSRRTSISTMETWIDDESYDNSFNEELEKRCTVAATKLPSVATTTIFDHPNISTNSSIR